MIYGAVYLAGPIAGNTLAEADDWRHYAALQLEMAGILAYSPLRAKRAIIQSKFHREDRLGTGGIDGHPLVSAKGITTRDRDDVAKCNVILMDLLCATRVSIGTMIEAGWADALRRPIVCVMEPGNIHEHGMLEELIGYRVSTLDEAIEIVKAILIPGPRVEVGLPS